MPVTYMEIENFKSYMGQQTIGPFKDFTSIIGPNGSGKSNLMDAISFVLGVQSRDLRSSQMKDLIFRPPTQPGQRSKSKQKQTLRAMVTLHFQDEDNRGEEIRFARAISPAGHGEYLVNGKSMTFAKYEERLADIGVLVKARNFLVFQGDVESIARKTPKEMVLLLEQISTSIDLAGDYDDALKQKEEADAAVMFEYNRSKGFRSERKLLKEQKEEAERFQELLETKANLLTDMYLWQLFHIDADIREQEETLVELRQELEEKKQAEKECDDALKEAKKKASAARRHTGSVDKARVKAAAEVDQMEPDMIRQTEEIKSLEKKIAAAEKQLAKKQKDAANHSGNLETIQEQTKEQQDALQQLEQDYEEIKRDAVGNANQEVTLTEEQEEELERVRSAAKAAALRPTRTLNDLTRQLNKERAKAGQLAPDLEEARKTLASTEAAHVKLVERKETMTSSREKTKKEWQAKEKELLETNQSLQASQVRREELDREIETINRKLRDVKESRNKMKNEERNAQTIATLKRNFPGVHGRLVDLCRPTQRRFGGAITVAAGKEMDSIVVENNQVAKDCIKYMKENHIPARTFLGLDAISVPSVESQERARATASRDSRYRLAADVVTCEDAFRPAVLFALGNTIVCDDLDCARELCFGTGRGSANQTARCKAVTLGGAVISQSGSMTGGSSDKNDKDQAGRWGAADVQALREKRVALENERSELDNVAESTGGARTSRSRGSFGHGSLIQELKNEIDTLKNKERFIGGDLTYTEKNLRETETLLKSLRRQITKLETDTATSESNITKLSGEVEKARKDVKEAEEEHLGPFREKTGLQDFDAYASAVGERRKEFNEERRKLMEHIAKLEQQRDYEASRDFEKPIANLEKRIEDNKGKLKKAKVEQKELKERLKEARDELAKEEAAVSEAADAEKICDEEVQEAQKEYSEAQSDRQKSSKSVSAGEAQIERLRGTLHETLQKARVEEVELPMIGENNESDSEDDDGTGNGTQSQMSSRGGSGSQTMTQESAAPHFSQADSRKVVRDKEAASKVDYSKLDEELKQRPSDREERRMKKDFEDQVNKLNQEIESTTPNMKAAEAFETVTATLKETNSHYDKVKEDAVKASAAFQKIKSQRAKLFNDAFNHIDESLKTIYTDMTKSSKHPLGGNAYLSLDDTEEPFKGGMKFNAMPPMKRFRDMEQLSGGEKTVAALSLLFAIHSYHPAPFFVMDEVDAALDNINLRKVCNYISQRSKTDFQCIVISLKDMFYERSESLVGVCRDVGTSSSRTLTLDLTSFDKKTKAKVTPEKSPKRGAKRKSKANDDYDDPLASPSPKKRGAKRKSKANDDEEEDDDLLESPSPKRSSRGRRSKVVATPTGEESDASSEE